MFGFLKKRLKSVVDKFSDTIEKEGEEAITEESVEENTTDSVDNNSKVDSDLSLKNKDIEVKDDSVKDVSDDVSINDDSTDEVKENKIEKDDNVKEVKEVKEEKKSFFSKLKDKFIKKEEEKKDLPISKEDEIKKEKIEEIKEVFSESVVEEEKANVDNKEDEENIEDKKSTDNKEEEIVNVEVKEDEENVEDTESKDNKEEDELKVKVVEDDLLDDIQKKDILSVQEDKEIDDALIKTTGKNIKEEPVENKFIKQDIKIHKKDKKIDENIVSAKEGMLNAKEDIKSDRIDEAREGILRAKEKVIDAKEIEKSKGPSAADILQEVVEESDELKSDVKKVVDDVLRVKEDVSKHDISKAKKDIKELKKDSDDLVEKHKDEIIENKKFEEKVDAKLNDTKEDIAVFESIVSESVVSESIVDELLDKDSAAESVVVDVVEENVIETDSDIKDDSVSSEDDSVIPDDKPVLSDDNSVLPDLEPVIEEEATGFFSRLKQKIVTKKITNEQFEDMFWDMEIALLENNIAVLVIEKIKDELKKVLVDKPIKRGQITPLILATLKKTINSLFEVEPIDLFKNIENKKPYVICLVGINGSGKTTTIAKLAKLMQNNNKTVLLAAADTFRVAAIEQLEEHANNLGVKMIKHDYNSDPAAVAFDAIKYAKAKNIDVVLIDTAGRLHSNTNLMEELKKIIRVSKPDLKIFIGEAITGNDCVDQAEQFNEAINIDGVILAKADIDDKGGAAISVSYVTKKPILYLGTGQKYDDLEVFDKDIIMKNLEL